MWRYKELISIGRSMLLKMVLTSSIGNWKHVILNPAVVEEQVQGETTGYLGGRASTLLNRLANSK